jgi:hypothetical protein
MAEIYLQHPLHGAKVAHMDLEADYDETNGWKRYIPFVEDNDEDIPEENVETPITNAFEQKRRRR